MRSFLEPVKAYVFYGLFLLLIIWGIEVYAQDQTFSDHEKKIKQEQDRIKNQLDPLLKQQSIFLQKEYKQQKLEVLADGKNTCFNINEIIVSRITAFLPEEINNITEAYEGRCIGLAQINNLVTQISNLYLEHGYVTSRAYIQPQDLSDGILDVLVIEGHIQAFTVGEAEQVDESQLTALQLALAFPQQSEGLLNLRDLEQGLENLNRLGQNQSTTALMPGDEQGSSIVQVNNQQSSHWRGSIGINNTGTDNTGEYQLDSFLIYENLLGLNDSLVSSFSSNIGGHKLPQSTSRSYSLVASIPYGYWLFSVNNSYYKYAQTVLGANVNFLTHGSSFNSSFIAQNTVYRGSADKLNLSVAFNRKESRNYIEDVFLETSSRTIYVWGLSVDYTRYFSVGTLTSAFHINKSVPWFDAKKELSTAEDDFQFIKYQADLTFSTSFSLGQQPIQLVSNLQLFHSPRVILASEGLSVGGRYSVRGLAGDNLFGYRGGYLKNDFYLPFETGLKVMPSLNVFWGIDVGTTNLPEYEDRNSDWVAGTVIGFQTRFLEFNVNVSYAKALRTPDFLNGQRQEIDLSIRYSF